MTYRMMPVLIFAAGLCACQSAAPDTRTDSFDQIAQDETVYFGGNEPFWGGEVTDGTLRYATPENVDGTMIAVSRFAGNSGLGFSGQLEGESFDLTITIGQCSDTMSDRSYPFTATLKIGEELRSGCAWTDAMPFTGPENP